MSKETTITCELGKGFLNQSENKKTESHPDFFGAININGDMFNLGGWKKTSKKDEGFLSLNIDPMGQDATQTEANRKEYISEYLKAKEEAEKGEYVTMNFTGTLHRQKDEKKKEDYFGSLKIEDTTVSIKAFAMKNKKGEVFLILEVSTGLASKEERSQMAEGLI